MARPQPGIFAQGTRSHYHLEFDLRPGVADADIVGALHGLREPSVTAGGSNIVVGFGPALWRRLQPGDAPAELADFEAIEGDGRRAPATQHDLWVWTHGTGEDVELDVARGRRHRPRAGRSTLAAEQPCFVYLDSRDLTGFIDGTENPPVEEAFDVALVPDGETGRGWRVRARPEVGARPRAVPRPDARAAAGHHRAHQARQRRARRTKPDTAHIARVVIEEDGEELELYRRSTPYGRVGELGLYFLAFSADPSRFTKMLAPHVRGHR